MHPALPRCLHGFTFLFFDFNLIHYCQSLTIQPSFCSVHHCHPYNVWTTCWKGWGSICSGYWGDWNGCHLTTVHTCSATCTLLLVSCTCSGKLIARVDTSWCNLRDSVSAILNVDLADKRWLQASLPVRWGRTRCSKCCFAGTFCIFGFRHVFSIPQVHTTTSSPPWRRGRRCYCFIACVEEAVLQSTTIISVFIGAKELRWSVM